MVLKRFSICVLVLAAFGALTGSASAASSSSGVQHLHFRFGPLNIRPGSNLIEYGRNGQNVEKPSEDGYITRIKPNLVDMKGRIPPTYKLHLHHGVFLNLG